MGVSDKMPTKRFDADITKPGAKGLKISKKNLFFLVFAVLILQVADTGILWLMGTSKSSQFSGDTFMFSAVIFCILKYSYDKYRSDKDFEQEDTEEVEYDCRQSATVVVDTMKVRTHFTRPAKKSLKPINESDLQPVTIWVSSWLRAPALNPKAKKFVPCCSSVNTLDSDAPAFVPQAHAQKEKQLLASESCDPGDVVYRSQHWVNQLGSPQKTQDSKSKSPDSKENAPKKSKSPEPAKLSKAKKWRPKVMWASAWSDVQVAMAM